MQVAASVCTGEPSVLELQAREPKRSSCSIRHQFADLPRLVPCRSGSADLLEDMLGQRLGNSRQGHDAGNASSSSTEVPPRSIILAAVDVRVDRRVLSGNSPRPSRHARHRRAGVSTDDRGYGAPVVRLDRREGGGRLRSARRHAPPAFVGAAVRHFDRLPRMVDEKSGSFLAAVKREPPLSVSEEKVLNAFALVCAAGTLAAEWEISPWSKERCVEARRHRAMGHFEPVAEAGSDPHVASIRAVARDDLIHSAGSEDAVDALINRLAERDGPMTRRPDGRAPRPSSVAGRPAGGGRKSRPCRGCRAVDKGVRPGRVTDLLRARGACSKASAAVAHHARGGRDASRKSRGVVWVRPQRSEFPRGLVMSSAKRGPFPLGSPLPCKAFSPECRRGGQWVATSTYPRVFATGPSTRKPANPLS